MTKSSKTSKRSARILWIVLYNCAFVVSIIIGVEYGSSIHNRRADEEPVAFLFDADVLGGASLEVLQTGGTGMTSYLDPHLGYANDPALHDRLDALGTMPGFVVYGNKGAPDPIRIVALGGSTTAPGNRKNWPKQLQEILSTEGISVGVYNGGVSGYSTNQELLKLIRDVLPLKPDIVISMSGVNDLGFIHSVQGHPMVHPYQQRFLEAVSGNRPFAFLPNTRTALRRWRESKVDRLDRVMGVNYGPVFAVTPAEQWAQNTRLMHAVSESSGIQYLSILQPVLGVGEYAANAQDAALMKEVESKLGGGYMISVKEFYDQARPLAREMESVTDLTDVFSGHSGLYHDARHPNATGYLILAKRIRDELHAQNLLSQKRDQTELSSP